MNYIVLDIEFNGRKFASPHPMEVIEIGAVRLDESLQDTDTFAAFIRPVYFAKLNSFIKKKTGIPQESIDAAPRFPKVIAQFREWLDLAPGPLTFVVWGGEDIKRIVQDVRMHKLEETYWTQTPSLDLLKGFLQTQGLKNDVSVEGALAMLNLETSGAAHRALDDAKMTADIFRSVYDKLDLTLVREYKDTFSNSKERRIVRSAAKSLASRRIAPTWELAVEHYLNGKIALEDPRKEAELRAYFDALPEFPMPARAEEGPAATSAPVHGDADIASSDTAEASEETLASDSEPRA
ncbi:3'-5' exonuclease [Saccharibacillus sp. CPCC 101409]|uniref:3'-5' exonuclease n=1 Tax=Saccharibacillus sp. CPCC 101409 TaxID=3058041 RepID=UPI002671D772|nr:3'-5' exonuclease [Saccharibacillus sp. CPCC 101409]MDO3408364.1 3'-5' exonuclease [Saccharibacillus sp. CPCC 101409]